MALAVTKENFESEVKEADIPVLVDFWGQGCPPCVMIEPIIEELSTEYRDKVKIVKVNVADAPEISEELDILGVPTLVLFRSGAEVTRHVGFVSKDQIIERLLTKA